MRNITKGPEPKSLTEHRVGEHCDYDNYAGKDELRQALVREQCGLCCYCMGRIRAHSDGLHDRTDEHCLEIAQSIRVVLAELSERLAQALKDEAELNYALSKLLRVKESG